jgi:HNH endonuclease
VTSDHVEADPRPRRRVKDTAAVRRKVRQDVACRACGEPSSDGHHILYRSKGGDDVEDNVVGLCHDCHMALHKWLTEGGLIRAEVGKRLRPEEIRYVLDRLGDDPGRVFLERYYSVVEDERFHVFSRRPHPRGIANLHALDDL